MQPQDAHFVGLAIGVDGQPLPQVGPAELVPVTYLFESSLAPEPALGPLGSLGRGNITAGDQGDDLLDAQRPTRAELGEDFMTDFEFVVRPVGMSPVQAMSPCHRLVRAASATGICDCVVSTVIITEFSDNARFSSPRM